MLLNAGSKPRSFMSGVGMRSDPYTNTKYIDTNVLYRYDILYELKSTICCTDNICSAGNTIVLILRVTTVQYCDYYSMFNIN